MRRIDTGKFGPWAIVTGASSGIGEEFARQLAASGLHLVLVARRLSKLETLGSELAQTFGISYRAVGLDLTADDFIEKLGDATHDLDIGLVISNAGAMAVGDFWIIGPPGFAARSAPECPGTSGSDALLWAIPGTARAWWAASRGIDDGFAGSAVRGGVCCRQSLCTQPGRGAPCGVPKGGCASHRPLARSD